MAFFDYNLQEKLKQYNYGMYMRKSSEDNEDKQMRSIEGQEQDLDQDVVQKFVLNDRIVARYREKKSAFKTGRSDFSALINQINEGLINALIVYHPNRLARNYADGGLLVQLMSDEKLQLVITPHGLFENTPRDKEYLMNEFTRATRDSDDKSVVVKRGNRTKLRAGHIPSGQLSQGYVHMRNDKGEMINTDDVERFPLLRKAIELILNGTHTPIEALHVLNDDMGYRTRKTRRMGGTPLAESTWYKMLNDTKYYGQISRTEGEFQSEFPQLMTKEEFEKIQILLGGKANRRLTKKEWPYTGEIVCEGCGGFITMEEKWQVICSECKTKFHKAKDRHACTHCGTDISKMHDPTILHYQWLHCGKSKKTSDGKRCPQPSVAVGNFESQVDRLLEKMTIPEKFTKWAISWLRKLHATEVKERTAIQKNFQGIYNDVQKQIDDLLDLRLRHSIDDEEYEKKKELLLLEKKEIKGKLQVTDKRADDWLELCERTFNFATYARVWFAKGSNQQKRDILHALGSNLYLDRQILSIQQHKPFVILNGMQERVSILMNTFEPQEEIDLTSQIESSDPSTLSLLAILDSNI